MRSAYVEHEHVVLVMRRPSRTKQSFVKECDINSIMSRYEKDGVLVHFNRFQGNYGAFSDAPAFHDAMNKVLSAESMFMSLPASIRSRFGNDPAQFITFATNEANKDELRKLGLLKDVPAAPGPVRVEVINPVVEPVVK